MTKATATTPAMSADQPMSGVGIGVVTPKRRNAKTETPAIKPKTP